MEVTWEVNCGPMTRFVLLAFVAETAKPPAVGGPPTATEGPRGTRTGSEPSTAGDAPPPRETTAAAADSAPLKLAAALGASALRPCSGARNTDPRSACARASRQSHQPSILSSCTNAGGAAGGMNTTAHNMISNVLLRVRQQLSLPRTAVLAWPGARESWRQTKSPSGDRVSPKP